MDHNIEISDVRQVLLAHALSLGRGVGGVHKSAKDAL